MRRRLLLGVATSLCLALGAAACAGDKGDSEADIKEQITAQLENTGKSEKVAECYAEVIIDEVGVEDLKDVDFDDDEPAPKLQTEIAAASLRADEECEPDGS